MELSIEQKKRLDVLKSTFSRYSWSAGISSFSGKILNKNPLTERDYEKNLIMYSHYNFFIANMNKDTDKEYFYCIIYQSALMRLFRKRGFNEIEVNKTYHSTKTFSELIEKIEKEHIFKFQL